MIFLIIFLLFFSRYFDYFIIICLFLFNRGYNVNNRLDFAFTVIKWHYNTNDQLKFILSFIRRDNGLNDRLKLVKNGRKENRKWTKWRWKLTKQEMNWKSRISKRRKIFTKLLTETSPKRYESTSAWIFFTKIHFSPKTAKIHNIGIRDPLEQSSSTYL